MADYERWYSFLSDVRLWSSQKYKDKQKIYRVQIMIFNGNNNVMKCVNDCFWVVFTRVTYRRCVAFTYNFKITFQ